MKKVSHNTNFIFTSWHHRFSDFFFPLPPFPPIFVVAVIVVVVVNYVMDGAVKNPLWWLENPGFGKPSGLTGQHTRDPILATALCLFFNGLQMSAHEEKQKPVEYE